MKNEERENRDWLSEKLDLIHNDVKDVKKEVKEWQQAHDGQGTGTTHDLLDKRLSAHSMWINILKGMGILLTALGLGNIAAWLTKGPGGP